MSHMGSRTYVPTLIRMLRKLCLYITRYAPVLRGHLTGPQQALLDEVMAACTALTESIGELPVNP